MSSFFQDVRFAVRDLRKGILVTSLAVLSLALAIGGNTAVFVFVFVFGILVRSAVEPSALAGTLRDELNAVDSRIAIGRIQTLTDFVDQFFVGANVFNTILTGFGILALLLAALGTYGVLAYNVAQRASEFGVRMALGAAPSLILRMVTRQGVQLGLLGLAIGTPAVFALARLIDYLLVNAPPLDVKTIVAEFVVLFVTTLAASYFPARRAASLDPIMVLRDE